MGLVAPACALQENRSVKDLNKKALSGVLAFVLTTGLCVFVPAWTVDYWHAWVLISVLSAPLLGITLHLMRNDPQLLKRRLRAGSSAERRRSLAVTALLNVLDHC